MNQKRKPRSHLIQVVLGLKHVRSWPQRFRLRAYVLKLTKVLLAVDVDRTLRAPMNVRHCIGLAALSQVISMA